MKISIIAFTAAGYSLAARLQAFLEAGGAKTERYRCRAGMLQDWTHRHFAAAEALIFIGATGIAVRAVAPCLQSKISDPAVVVIDEGGKFVIPILSGHLGGANRLAQKIAAMLAATPVLTTATECNGVFAIDSWAGENQVRILNPERIKSVAARLLAGGEIYLQSIFPVAGALPEGFIAIGGGTIERCDVIITVKTGAGDEEALRLVPPVLTLGIGCRKGTAEKDIQEAFNGILEKAGCHREAVCRVCTIDLKAREAGILSFCKTEGLPLQTYSAEQLRAVPGPFTSSSFVQEITGVDNVCERSAVLGSGGKILVRKSVEKSVALALAIAPYTLRFGEEQ